MNQSQLNSNIRDILKFSGVLLAAHGYQQASSFLGSDQIIGAIVALVGFAWSYFHHASPPGGGGNTPSTGATALLVAGLLCLGSAGCSSPQTNTYRAEGVTIQSVDTAMHLWADYVTAGKATQAQVDTVKKIYETYFDAQQVAKAALEKWLASGTTADATAATLANQAVTDAVTATINLINLYTGK